MTDLVWQSLAAGSLLPETVEEVTALNTLTAVQGLTLTEAQAAELVAARREALVQTGRVEFGSGVTERRIRAFYTSPYLTKETYAETLQALTELFYQLKNETDDRVGDDALLASMCASCCTRFVKMSASTIKILICSQATRCPHSCGICMQKRRMRMLELMRRGRSTRRHLPQTTTFSPCLPPGQSRAF